MERYVLIQGSKCNLVNLLNFHFLRIIKDNYIKDKMLAKHIEYSIQTKVMLILKRIIKIILIQLFIKNGKEAIQILQKIFKIKTLNLVLIKKP